MSQNDKVSSLSFSSQNVTIVQNTKNSYDVTEIKHTESIAKQKVQSLEEIEGLWEKTILGEGKEVKALKDHHTDSKANGKIRKVQKKKEIYDDLIFNYNSASVRHVQMRKRWKKLWESVSSEMLCFVSHLCLEKFEQYKMPLEEKNDKEKFILWISNILHEKYPECKVHVIGSFANGFANMNSDLDISVDFGDKKIDKLQALDYLAEIVEQNDYKCLKLTKTRIPLVRIRSDSKKRFNHSFKCDINYCNDLAIYNTRLLKAYSKMDDRVMPLVLFIKFWSKARKVNDTYYGTLCSYGYVLMVLHFLTNVVNPPVLLNLQLKVKNKEIHNGCNVSFKTVENFFSKNKMPTGTLLFHFFLYYAVFNYETECISIKTRGGIVKKAVKGWFTKEKTVQVGDLNVKNRYFIAIEDPFEHSHNVGRTVTKGGFYKIKLHFLKTCRAIAHNEFQHYLDLVKIMEEPLEGKKKRKDALENRQDNDEQSDDNDQDESLNLEENEKASADHLQNNTDCDKENSTQISNLFNKMHFDKS